MKPPKFDAGMNIEDTWAPLRAIAYEIAIIAILRNAGHKTPPASARAVSEISGSPSSNNSLRSVSKNWPKGGDAYVSLIEGQLKKNLGNQEARAL